MTSNVALYIALEPGRGRPVSLARLDDPTMLRQVARAAVLNARQQAIRASGVDQTLGVIRSEEADQLERRLSLLIPA